MLVLAGIESTSAAGIALSLPTIELLISRGARVIISGACGPDTNIPSFAALTDQAAKLLGHDVMFDSEIGTYTGHGPVVLLENLVALGRAEKSEKDLARKLAEQIDIFVNDNFESCALELPVITSLPGLVPSAAGMNLFAEIEAFDSLAQGKDRPATLIVGGVGLGRKLKLIQKLIPVVDTILIGGGLPYTFLKSRAVPVGNSIVEQGLEVDAFQTLEKAQLGQKEVFLPSDHVAAEQLSRSAKKKNVGEIPPRWTALDIGPKTLSTFEKIVKKSSFVFWYGPLGVIEMEGCTAGTAAVAKILKKTKARVIVTGNETVDFVRRESGEPEGIVFCRSSQAALDYLTRNTLPGIEAMRKEA